MLNNFITKISPSVRIIVLIFLIFMLLLAKSIYLVLFITILTLILFIITDKKVNMYVKGLQKILLLLLIFFVTYIIMFRGYNLLSIIFLLFKLIIIANLIEIFLLNIEFKSLHEGLYGIFLPLRKFNIDVEKFSFDLILSLYFVRILITSKDRYKTVQAMERKRILGIKKFFLSRLVYTINQFNILQDCLQIKFYKLNYKKVNLKSKIMFVLFLLLFILCIYKEVVL